MCCQQWTTSCVVVVVVDWHPRLNTSLSIFTSKRERERERKMLFVAAGGGHHFLMRESVRPIRSGYLILSSRFFFLRGLTHTHTQHDVITTANAIQVDRAQQKREEKKQYHHRTPFITQEKRLINSTDFGSRRDRLVYIQIFS